VHTEALLRDGTVWAWGSNESHVLGNGTHDNANTTPTRVKDLSDVKRIIVPNLVEKMDGSLWVWGRMFHTFFQGSREWGWIPKQTQWDMIGIPVSSKEKQPESNDTIVVQPGSKEKLAIAQHFVPEVKQPLGQPDWKQVNSDGLDVGADQKSSPEQDPNLKHFISKNLYKKGQFSDLGGTEWFVESVLKCFELGLMNGKEQGKFDPNGSILLSEAVTLAARVNNIYHGGEGNLPTTGDTWFEGAVAYAVNNKIITTGDFTDFNQPATRAQLAYIFSKAVPDSILAKVNNVANIPDVSESQTSGDSIYRLYRAGVLSGSDEQGNFRPNAKINRAEAAAIILRVVKPEFRMVMREPVMPEPVGNGTGQIKLNMITDSSTELSDYWTRMNITLKDHTGRKQMYMISTRDDDTSYGYSKSIDYLSDGMYAVTGVSSEYANISMASTMVVVKNGQGSLDLKLTPRYTLEVGKNGQNYNFSFINIESIASKVFSGSAPQIFGVTADESYMIQDQDTKEVFTVNIQKK
jgi:hypothetical protein